MSYSYWQASPSKKYIKTDFLIIGGGIAGFSTAYWLEKKYPEASITIVEKFKMGSGASGRNAGFITCGSAEHFAKLVNNFGASQALEIWKFSEMNRELLKQEIIKGNSDKVLFRTTGSCTVAANSSDKDRYQELAQTMSQMGIDVQWIDQKKMELDYAVKASLGGIEYKGDGVVHPFLLLKEIQAQLKKTQCIEDQEVFRIQNDKSVNVETQNFHFESEKVILTLNAYIGQLWPDWQKIVRPQRGQILVTEPLPLRIKGPCYLTKHLCYFRQMPTGELLIGGFRNLDLENENTYLDQVSDIIQNALFDFTKEFFDFTSEITIKNQWSGIMGFTDDGQMLIGSVPNLKNIYLMAGCSGHGMGLSFHAAKVLVDHITGQNVPSYFSMDRLDSMSID